MQYLELGVVQLAQGILHVVLGGVVHDTHHTTAVPEHLYHAMASSHLIDTTSAPHVKRNFRTSPCAGLQGVTSKSAPIQ